MEGYIQATRRKLESLQSGIQNVSAEAAFKAVAEFIQFDLQDGINNLLTAEQLISTKNAPGGNQGRS